MYLPPILRSQGLWPLFGAILIAVFLGSKVSCRDNTADAAPSHPTGYELADMAPGNPIWSNEIRSVDDSDTLFFEFDGDADGADATDLMPFPDGSVVTISNQTASTYCTCAWLDREVDDIGAQSADDTAKDVAGVDNGPAVTIEGGQSVNITLRQRHRSVTSAPGYYAGWCSGASNHVRSRSQSDPNALSTVYVPCDADGDCSGGLAGATGTCQTSERRSDRASFLGCRCSAAATLVATMLQR